MLLFLSRFSFALMLLCLLLNPRLEARWALENEVDVECLQNDITYTVDKSGEWTREITRQLRILTEAGRESLSTITCAYDASRSKLEIIEAKTSYKGEEFIIPKQKIEDKPLASDPSGIKNDHQILIPFEHVTIGSILHIQIKQKMFKPDFKNYFYEEINFGDECLWRGTNVVILSDLPLFSKINDKKNVLEVKEEMANDKYILRIKLKKPIIEKLIGEQNTSLDPQCRTHVTISTERDYQRIGKILGQNYKPVLAAQLPKPFDNIKSMASKIKDETDCINQVVSQLIKKITYLGNWDTAEGHIIARNLEEIAKTGYGDCKDYSVCLAAILNALGYKAQVAFVNRNDRYIEEQGLPSAAPFNHAIVKAISPSQRTYWIDPTNITTMADGIYPDIADRPVLVIDAENPIYERIPPIDLHHATVTFEEEVTIGEEGHTTTTGSLYLQGEQGICLTRVLSSQPISVAQEHILKNYCNGGHEPINSVLTLPNSISHIVRPLKIDYRYEKKNTMMRTNLGYAFPLYSTWDAHLYVATTQKDEGALIVGHPGTHVKKTIFKNVKAENLDSLAFSIKTPWLNVKRELLTSDEGIIVIETAEQLKSVIPAKDLKSAKFQELREMLRKYCNGVAIILSQQTFPTKK